MESTLRFPLQVSPAQAQSLESLQHLFAEACNFLAPIVRDNRCWNRVALHHLAYRALRERFPQLGSQMACNAIYSVCRSARVVYQRPDSRWCVQRNPGAPLPLLRFLPTAPVFFDRHTLSLKGDRLSMFTLDGRLHFRLALDPEMQARFRGGRLREIALVRKEGRCLLYFSFGAGESTVSPDDLPEYLLVQDASGEASPAFAAASLAA